MKKLLSLLLTAVCAILYAPPAKAWTVYLNDDNTYGITPHVYLWDGGTQFNGEYPGGEMTYDSSNNLWYATGSGSPANIIFNNGSDGDPNKLFYDNGTFVDGAMYIWNGTYQTTWSYTIPQTPITGVKLVRLDGNQTETLTSTDGITWTWGDTSLKTYNDGTSTTDRSYQLVVEKEGDYTEKLYYSQSNFGFNLNNSYGDNLWKTTTGSEHFRFRGSDNNQYYITVTLSADRLSVASLTYSNQAQTEQTPVSYTFMPLTEADFADGPRYFLVGTRTSDWRLQPEWEFTPTANGSYTLSGRLISKQLFGIAKVDTYNDYIWQRYTLYSAKGESVTYSGQSLTLTEVGPDQATRYDDASTIHKGDDKVGNYMKWCSDGEGWETDDWIQSKPAYLESAELSLSGDVPVSVTFKYLTDAETIAANRTFTLVGTDIRYNKEFTFSSGTGLVLDEKSHVWTSSQKSYEAGGDNFHQVHGWENSWIQSTAGGVPYFDAWGNTIYNTAFDATWMSAHNTVFYNDDKDLYFNSASVTFIPVQSLNTTNDEYADLYKMHPGSAAVGATDKIGDGDETPNVGDFSYTEILIDHYKDDNGHVHDDEIVLDKTNWQCMVIKDIWLSGEFKIWSGWGGNLKMGNNVPDGDLENNAQWFYQNGGHGEEGNKTVGVNGYDVRDANEVKLYRTRQDVDEANFYLSNMTYYPRIILWYNPDEGFDQSVIQLVTASVGPNIQAFRNTANTLNYKWWITTDDATSHANDVVKGYTVTRYRVNADGTETAIGVVESKTYSDDTHTVSQFLGENNAQTFNDPWELAAGYQYRYGIQLTIDYADNSGTRYKNALSNQLPVYDLTSPVLVDAVQQTETGEDGATLYSFNVELNATLSGVHLSRPVGDVTVKDVANNYVVVVDDDTYTRLTGASSLTVASVDGSEPQTVAAADYIKTAATDTEVLIGYENGANKYLPVGTHYFTYTATGGAALPAHVWHNVAPTTDGFGNALNDIGGNALTGNGVYSFTIYLVSSAELIEQWATMNFTSASDVTSVIAPTTTLTVEKAGLRRVNNAEFTDNAETSEYQHPSGSRLLQYDSSGSGSYTVNVDDPIHYNRVNEAVMDVAFAALPVTQEVIKYHKIDYTVIVCGKKVDEYFDGTWGAIVGLGDCYVATNAVSEPSAPSDAIEAKTAEITNLPVGDFWTVKDIDGVGERVEADGATLDTYLRVSYTPNWTGISTTLSQTAYYNDHNDPQEAVAIFDVQKPEVEISAVQMAKYRDQYWNAIDETGAGEMEYPGYFTHGLIDLKLSNFVSAGIDGNSLNAYVGFHAPQKVKNDKYGTCYGFEGNELYKNSFAGTRAANGGHPMNEGWHESWTSVISPLSGDFGTSEGEITYQDYTEGEGSDPWSNYNDWSTMAVKSSRLPLHINPLYEYPDADAYNAKDHKFNGSITAQVSALYPVIDALMANEAMIMTFTGESATLAPAMRADDETRYVEAFIVVGRASDPVSYNLANASMNTTGVEEILGDDTDTPAEYYNLQGIRVQSPAKGQVYIVRSGAKVAKLLYK